MFCTDSCEHNSPSRQQQQFLNMPSCSMQHQQLPEASKKDEVARIGVCFVTERPEGLSIECNIPIPKNFKFESYNLPHFKEGSNSTTYCNQQTNIDNTSSYGYGFADTSPVPMQVTTTTPISDVTNSIGTFLGYNLGIPVHNPTPTQATLQLSTQPSVPGSNYSPQRQQVTTCCCMPIQRTVTSSQCPNVGSLPTSQPQQCNFDYSCITPPAPPQQQQNQSVAVDCPDLLNVCNCMPTQNHLQQQFQQQMEEQLQQPAQIDSSGIIPRKQQIQQQQQMLNISNKTDHQEQGICAMRLDLPCFLTDCNRNSLPLQPVQQQQIQITQQQQQQQPQQQQQHQQFINQQQQIAHHSFSCSRVDVGAYQNQQQRQHKPPQQLQTHQTQQQQQQLQIHQQQQQKIQPLQEQQQQQQVVPLNKNCDWNPSDYPYNNHLDSPSSNNNFPPNNLVNFQPNNCMKNGCGVPCCWHFPRYWFWNPCVGFLRVNCENNSCKNNACNQRR